MDVSIVLFSHSALQWEEIAYWVFDFSLIESLVSYPCFAVSSVQNRLSIVKVEGRNSDSQAPRTNIFSLNEVLKLLLWLNFLKLQLRFIEPHLYGSVSQLKEWNTLGFVASSDSLRKLSWLAIGLELLGAGWYGECSAPIWTSSYSLSVLTATAY